MTESLSEQGITRVYIVRRGELEIEAPSSAVWPYLLDFASWQNYSVVEHISGPVGAQGEVVLLSKEEKGYSAPPYYARTIRIEPGQRVIWKTFREGDDYFGIVEFAIHDTETGTRLEYGNLYEHVLDTTDPDEVEAFRREREAAITNLGSAIFPRLKNILESENATRP